MQEQQLSDEGRPAKRQRTGLACVECRERKRKCDGARPVCGACSKRTPQPTCVYTDENLKRGSSQYVDSLRARIRELERICAQYASQSQPLSDISSVPESSATPLVKAAVDPSTSRDRRIPKLASSLPSHISHSSSGGTEHGLNSDEHNEAEWAMVGMGPHETVSGRTRGKPSNVTYFGPSSMFGFMRQLQQTVTDTDDTLHSYIVSVPATDEKDFRLGDALEKVPISLPPRSEADDLINGYFTGVGSLYPFLHRASFEARYSTIWEDGSEKPNTRPAVKPQDRVFYSLLNAMFALGVHFSRDIKPKDRTSVGETYCKRSLTMLNFGLLAQGSMEMVQVLLLLGQYLQCTDMPGLCWNIVGLAIRVAQSIGLHIPRSEKEREARPLMAEMRSRVFGGCITLDRVMAMMYGRPMTIPPNHLTDYVFPSIEDQDLRMDGTCEAVERSTGERKMLIYVHSLKLIMLLGEIQDSLYAGSLDPIAEEDQSRTSFEQSRLRKLLDFDAALVRLQQDWPPHLQIGIGSASPLAKRQAATLRARYLHMRLYLLRPFLLVLHRRQMSRSDSDGVSVDDLLATNTLKQVTDICLTTTQELIDMIYLRTMDSTADLSFAWTWWHNCFYINACASVVHAARLFHPHGTTHFNQDDLSVCWKKCVQCLDKYASYGQFARRCRKAMSRLESQLKKSSDKSPTQAQPTAHAAVAPTESPQGIAMVPLQDSPAMSLSYATPGPERGVQMQPEWWETMQYNDPNFGLGMMDQAWDNTGWNTFIGGMQVDTIWPTPPSTTGVG